MTDLVIEQTSTELQGPSDKEKKYDRQLRIWAAQGQQALEHADILLINSGSGAVGVEILKNLVLPGTLVHSPSVQMKNPTNRLQADFGVNFFLEESSLGKSRAECCVKFLQELNHDVSGEFHSTLSVPYLQSLFGMRCFSFILCTLPVEADILSTLKEQSTKTKIPLILTHSVGFYSYFRSILPVTIPIVETHHETEATTDLRLLNPWKELSDYSAALTKDIEKLSDFKHGHIPYISLLLHFLKDWKRTHGRYPNSYAEKIEFRKKIIAGSRKSLEGTEENFDEAVAAVLKNIKIPMLSSDAREVFEYQTNDIEANSSFWIISDAVKQFYEKNEQLPLPGSVPDMKAESMIYIQLQNIYKTKARQDAIEVFETVLQHPNGKSIKLVDVENFCKNAAHIKLIHASNEAATDLGAIAKSEFENDEVSKITSQPLSLLPIYLALNAISHVPTASASDIISRVEKDVPIAASNDRVHKVAQEVARAKGGELHNISAITGGMVAQEVIKIVTRQYTPIDNTCIFDGITSRVQVMRI
ncbi:hypothetical protein Golomagni_00692 [Golovinomyces magnicellulatus]|nr:hypothetical protein Golomagni_00692 [Golovinomyces magnicellulatus]